jgi:hypothetical protein
MGHRKFQYVGAAPTLLAHGIIAAHLNTVHSLQPGDLGRIWGAVTSSSSFYVTAADHAPVPTTDEYIARR